MVHRSLVMRFTRLRKYTKPLAASSTTSTVYRGYSGSKTCVDILSYREPRLAVRCRKQLGWMLSLGPLVRHRHLSCDGSHPLAPHASLSQLADVRVGRRRDHLRVSSRCFQKTFPLWWLFTSQRSHRWYNPLAHPRPIDVPQHEEGNIWNFRACVLLLCIRWTRYFANAAYIKETFCSARKISASPTQ